MDPFYFDMVIKDIETAVLFLWGLLYVLSMMVLILEKNEATGLNVDKTVCSILTHQ